MTAALLLGNGTNGVQQRRPSATLVFELPSQPQQRQWHHPHSQQQQNEEQQQFVSSSSTCSTPSAPTKSSSDQFGGEQQLPGKAVAVSNSTQQQKQLTGDDLPLQIWQRIGQMATLLDRIHIGQCNKRMREAMSTWTDVAALDIRPIGAETVPKAETIGGRTVSFSVPIFPRASTSSSVSFRGSAIISAKKAKTCSTNSRKAFRVRIELADGRTFRLRTDDGRAAAAMDAEKQLKTLMERIGGEELHELTIWNGCLSDRFRGVLIRCCTPALRTLRLWNCSRYLFDYASAKRRRPFPSLRSRRHPLLSALFALPQLRQLLILDTVTPEGPGVDHQFAEFTESLAKKIKAPLEEFQLTACRLPLAALRQLRAVCAHSLRRLAIGCIWGEDRREQYLHELGKFQMLADLDLPPFLFCLADNAQPDEQMEQLFDQLTRLKAIGFRHFKSSVLFRFIEHHLPDRISALRVHHSVHRMPNFAQLGHPPSPAPSSSFSSANLPSPRPSHSVRSVSLLFGHGIAVSPDSQRGSLLRQKKGSIVSHRSSLLSSSHSSVRSDSLCSAPVFPSCRSSVSLRSVTAFSSAASVFVPLRRPFQSSRVDAIPALSTVTYSAVSSPFSSSTVTSSSSSTSSLGGGADSSPFSVSSPSATTPTVGQYRGKSLSLGAEIGGTARETPTKRDTKANSMPTSSTWCALSPLRDVLCRKISDEVPQRQQQQNCHCQPSSLDATDVTTSQSDDSTEQRRMAQRRLTIVAVAEERIGGGDDDDDSNRNNSNVGGRRRRTRGSDAMREQWNFGIRIVYVPPSKARQSQEVLGRMGSPIEARFIYHFGAAANASKREQVRLVDGDFVWQRPLSEFGMESDYENEEDEAEG